jgi:hypothetical protein
MYRYKFVPCSDRIYDTQAHQLEFGPYYSKVRIYLHYGA